MAYNVSTADVESRWRPLSDAESDVATTLLDDALVLIDVQRPALAAAVASGLVAERIVAMTAAEAVIRVLANPDRLSNQSITADGGISIGWQFEAKVPAPRLRVTDLDFESIDQALANIGLSTGRTASLLAKNSTTWAMLNGSGDDADPVLPFPYTKLDSAHVSDTFVLVVQ